VIDLPNDTVYAESCASIGLMLFARRMLEMEADNGANLHHLSLPENSEFRIVEGKGIFAHKMLIQAEGIGCHVKDTDALWQYDRSPVQRQPQTLTFIPWFSWANREEGEMRIWVDEA